MFDFWLLMLTKPARLYEGTAEGFIEIESKPFPIPFEDGAPPSGETGSPCAENPNIQFYRRVESAVAEIVCAHPLPLIVAGPERWVCLFATCSPCRDLVAGEIIGPQAAAPLAQLMPLIAPQLEAYQARGKQIHPVKDAALYAAQLV